MEVAIKKKEREIYEKMFKDCTGELTDDKMEKLKQYVTQLQNVNDNEFIKCYCPSDFDLMPECACLMNCKECWYQEYKEND